MSGEFIYFSTSETKEEGGQREREVLFSLAKAGYFWLAGLWRYVLLQLYIKFVLVMCKAEEGYPCELPFLFRV